MKVFLYEEPNNLNLLFLKPEYEIPFIGTNLLKFSKTAFKNLSDSLNEDLYFYVPEDWDVEEEKYHGNILSMLNEDTPELVFFTNVYSLFFADLELDYIHHLKQNRGKSFSRNGTICSYMSKSDGLKEYQEDDTLRSFFQLNDDNYLRTSIKLLNVVDYPSLPYTGDVFGNPFILSENIENSTICGPSFIGPNVHVTNSYIAPGTILSGNTVVYGSKIFSSILHDSNTQNSELTSSVAVSSVLENVKAENSRIPSGGVVHSERQI